MGASVIPQQDPLKQLLALKSQRAAQPDPLQQLMAMKAGRVSPWAGMAVSATQGATGGFADEIGGFGDAVTNAASDILHGRPTHFTQDYEDSRDAIRATDKDFASRHPALHAAGEIGGAIVPALLTSGAAEAAIGTKLGAGFGSKVAASALTGGATSAVYGAGNADGSIGDRVKAGAESILPGVAIGAAAPVAGRVLSGATRQIPKLLRNTTGLGTKAEAISQLGEIVNQSGMTPAEIAARASADKAAGSPVMLADAIGDNGRKLVRWVVNKPSEGGADLAEALRNRNAGQYDRIVTGAKTALGQEPANVPQTIEGIIEQRRQHAEPLYRAAHADPDFASQNLDAAMTLPPFRKALDVGQSLAHADDVAEAMKTGAPIPAKPLPIGAPDPQQSAANRMLAEAVKAHPGMEQPAVERLAKVLGADPATLDGAPGVQAGVSVPIKVLDYTKRYLDKGITRGFDAQSGFDHSTAAVTNNVLGQVLDDVDAARPNFAKARSVYHSDSRMLDVAETAKKALSMPPDELEAAMKTMNPSEQGLLRSIALSDFKNRAGSVADRNDLSKRFLADPSMRARFKLLAPDAKSYADLQALADRETQMARTLNAAEGNSTTAAQQQFDAAINGGVSPADIAMLPLSPHRTLLKLTGRAGQWLRDQSNIKLANQLGPMLTSEPGTGGFDDVINAIQKSRAKGNSLSPAQSRFLKALSQAFASQGEQSR